MGTVTRRPAVKFTGVVFFTRLAQFSISVYMLLLTATVSYLVMDLFVPAEIPLSLTILETRIHPNEPLRYLAVFRRIKTCRTEVQRFIVSQQILGIGYSNMPLEQSDPGAAAIPKQDYLPTEGVEEVGYRDSIIGVIEQGPDPIVKTISIMKHPWLHPGKYTLRNYVFSQCTLISRIDPYPEAQFEVLDQLETK